MRQSTKNLKWLQKSAFLSLGIGGLTAAFVLSGIYLYHMIATTEHQLKDAHVLFEYYDAKLALIYSGHAVQIKFKHPDETTSKWVYNDLTFNADDNPLQVPLNSSNEFDLYAWTNEAPSERFKVNVYKKVTVDEKNTIIQHWQLMKSGEDDWIKELESTKNTYTGILGALATLATFLVFIGTLISFTYTQKVNTDQLKLSNEQFSLGETWKYHEFFLRQIEFFNNDRAIVNIKRMMEWLDADYPVVLEFECVPSFIMDDYKRTGKSDVSFPTIKDPGIAQRFHIRLINKQIAMNAFTPDEAYKKGRINFLTGDYEHIAGTHTYLENLIAFDMDRFCDFLIKMVKFDLTNSKSLERANLLRDDDKRITVPQLIDLYWFFIFVKSTTVKGGRKSRGDNLRWQIRQYITEYTPEVKDFFVKYHEAIKSYDSGIKCEKPPWFEMKMQIKEITEESHPLWQQWWDIYSNSFPPAELEKIGYYRKIFDKKKAGKGDKYHILSMTVKPNEVIGIGVVELSVETKLGLLWYIATRSDIRGLGIGSEFYKYIINFCRNEGAETVAFEVDLPKGTGSIENRRIAWYQRQGAKYVEGIRYTQVTGILNVKVPMALMVHELTPVGLDTLYGRLQTQFKSSLEKTGTLRLT